MSSNIAHCIKALATKPEKLSLGTQVIEGETDSKKDSDFHNYVVVYICMFLHVQIHKWIDIIDNKIKHQCICLNTSYVDSNYPWWGVSTTISFFVVYFNAFTSSAISNCYIYNQKVVKMQEKLKKSVFFDTVIICPWVTLVHHLWMIGLHFPANLSRKIL